METSNVRFPKTFSKCVDTLFKIKGSLAGKDIIISISPAEKIIMLVLNVLTNL